MRGDLSQYDEVVLATDEFTVLAIPVAALFSVLYLLYIYSAKEGRPREIEKDSL